MKKIISAVLAIIIAVSSFSAGLTAFAADTVYDITGFRLYEKEDEYGTPYLHIEWDKNKGLSKDNYDLICKIGKKTGDIKDVDEHAETIKEKKGKLYVEFELLGNLDYSFWLQYWGEDDNAKFNSPTLTHSTSGDVPRVSYISHPKKYTINVYSKYKMSYTHIYKYNSKKKKYEFFKKGSMYGNDYKFTKKEKYKIKAVSCFKGQKFESKFSNFIVPRNDCNKQIKINSAKSNKNGKITVKWKKVKGASGYVINTISCSDKFIPYHVDMDNEDNFGTKQGEESIYSSEYVKVPNGKTTSKTISEFEGVTYWVCVTPYFIKGNGYCFGKTSSLIKVCVKSKLKGKINTNKVLNSAKLKPQKADNKQLDKILDIILKKYTNKDMTTAQKVYACYKYVSNERFSTYGVKVKANDCPFTTEEDALELLRTKKGDCVSYNSLIIMLMKKIGFTKLYLAGGTTTKSGGGWTQHFWCVAKINGKFYIFDPRLAIYSSDKNTKMYFCVPVSDKNSVAQKYRYYLPYFVFGKNNDFALA
ncbi:MAG: transglutaminase domain-containing protein [Eubacterium sp.]|nr:transglutaminase domain-containing protein [Eubacterium sp.]MBR0412437.1 transglutaminase domain-containing protein [Eubacterium sp.]